MKYGIISDIHSDIVALKKILTELEKLNVDKIFCCGDLVGYGNFPDAVVKIIKQENITCVAGNHEKALFYENDYQEMNVNAQKAINENLNFLSEKDLLFLKQLPDYLTYNNMRFVHGIPPNSYKYYISYLDNDDLKNIFRTFTEQIAFCGHTHIYGFFEFSYDNLFVNRNPQIDMEYQICKNKKYIINVGSVSLSRNSKNNQFVIYDDKNQIIVFK